MVEELRIRTAIDLRKAGRRASRKVGTLHMRTAEVRQDQTASPCKDACKVMGSSEPRSKTNHS